MNFINRTRIEERKVKQRASASVRERFAERLICESMKKKIIWAIIPVVLIVAIVLAVVLMKPDTPAPTEPTTPGIQDTQPSVPTNPTDPAGPTDPDDPTKPTEPVDPTKPTEPTNPTKPTEPTEPPHVHAYKEDVVEATCTEKGYISYTCECGDTYDGNEAEALGHNYSTEVVTATCEKGGYSKYTCSRCGHEYTDDETEAKGHKFGDWTVTKEATCTEDGSKTRKCERCEHTEEAVLKAVGHEFVSKVTKQPTCTEKGIAEGVCATCGEKTEKTVPATGHTMVDGEIVGATCQTPGHKEKVCTVCGEKTTEEIPVTDHLWTIWETIKEPTDTEPGERKCTCIYCGATKTEEIPCNHIHNWEKVVVQPGSGCFDHGYEQMVCTTCGYEGKKEYKTYLLAPGHDWSDWGTTKEPGPGVAGEEARHCKRCGEHETRGIEPLGDNGEKLESYIDPKVETKEAIGQVYYKYGKIKITDYRTSWGDYLYIAVNEDENVVVRFCDKEGKMIEVIVEVMDGYDLTCLSIREDGTYDYYGFNGFH